MSRPVFCLAYPTGTVGPMELHKELGMIPLEARARGYVSLLLCYAGKEIPKRWRGIRIRKMPRWPALPFAKSLSRHLPMVLWLWWRAPRIGVLTIVHYSRAGEILAKVYRHRNPRGRLYFKTDLSTAYRDDIAASERALAGFASMVAASSITGVETSAMLEAAKGLLARRPGLSEKLRLMPNGFSAPSVEGRTKAKERIFLYVGYVGTEAKNSGLLLDAFESLQPCDWRLELVGPVADPFAARIEAFAARFPGRLRVPGPILDREALYERYRRAAVFCLCSRWESFNYALLEAASFDDILVSTEVGVARDLIEEGRNGFLVEAEAAAFAAGLRKAMGLFETGGGGVDNSELRGRYSWGAVLAPLFDEKMEP